MRFSSYGFFHEFKEPSPTHKYLQKKFRFHKIIRNKRVFEAIFKYLKEGKK